MAIQNGLVKKQEQPKTFGVFMTSDAVKKRVNDVIGSKDGLRFISSIVSAVTTNPALATCDHSTILSAALQGEVLKLSPSTQLGYYYLVPYENKKLGVTQAQFQIGYKGYIQLAMRTGAYKKIIVSPIKEGELKNWNTFTEDFEAELIEDEDLREKSKTIGYYAMFEYVNGFRKVMYWPKQKMLKHADTYSKAFSVKATTGKVAKKSFEDYEAGKVSEEDMWKYSSYWYKDFDGMACKTMLRQLLSKWGIMSIDLETALSKDEAVLDDKGNAIYVDNDTMPIETSEEPDGTVEENNVNIEVSAEPNNSAVADTFFD